LTYSEIANKPVDNSGSSGTGGSIVNVDFLATLGNFVQLAGLFISILAGVTAMKHSSTALDEAEERIMRLQQEIGRWISR
jgi:hypothetical protein